MHPSALLMIVVVAGAAVVHGDPAAITPAAQFWQQALPGTTMPAAIADLVQQGIDHSPLVEHYSVMPSISPCILFNSVCDPRMVAETGIFFHEAQLRPGSAMTLSFPAEVESAILPHDVAGKVPFGNLGDVLATFSIPAGSAEAAQVRDTLRRCQEPPVAGEVKACATSLEGTVRSAMDMLGSPSQGVWAATSVLPRGGLPRQPYFVEAVTPLDGGRYVSCHRVPFPYAVYQCHIARRGYRAYVASLKGLSGGPAASMLAFCHVDTSSWNPAHPAFEVLNTRPGGTPVCHFMPYGDVAFVKKAGRAY
ncbi:BURP domain-containing protein 13-like [Panicum miliaceum]|uniref:BURP domain-containing protein 13-like n=1 Tax=Panicum miliaceum TaxID=4540 RepID=A0A3L6RDU1_PANMI|nr:BURP domain-containing protein 13-like [Panicum miliaceum]